MSDVAIGVDIGGTKIAFALVDQEGNVLQQHRIPTQPGDGVHTVIDRITEGIQQLMLETERLVSGIGIGCPGLINPATGVVRNAVNLKWEKVPLRDEIQERLRSQLPIHVHHDTNASCIGELMFGAAQGMQNFVHIALGTGFGAGAVVNGQLLTGADALAMEIGHMSLYPGGRLCSCGLRGCPEMYAPGVGLLASAREFAPDFPDSPLAQNANRSTADILDAARQNDPLAMRIIKQAAEALGRVMIFCTAILNPELIVIGGGIGQAFYYYMMPDLAHLLSEHTLPAVHERLRLLPSQISVSAVGAAALVWYYA